MPLDPQAKALLDQIAAQNAPVVETLSPREARMLMEASAMTFGPKPEVGRVSEVAIPGPAGPLRARVTAPAGAGPFPGLVFFFGGGWVTGSLNSHDHLCRTITNAANAVVVAVDYRLAPEHPFPAAVDDATAGTFWVSDHAEELGIDPSRLAVGGVSAGGNLAAVAALRARGRINPPLALQLLIYPIIDASLDTPSYLENAEGYILTREAMRWYWSQYVPNPSDRSSPDASPLRAPDHSGLPPALVVSVEYDPLRDEAEAYARRLAEAGVPVRLTRYDGMVHGFLRRYGTLDQGKAAIDEIAAVLRSGRVT